LICEASGKWSGPTPTCVPRQYRLTIAKTGKGTGTVTSAEAGISCGTACEVMLDAGTIVTLTAKADPNQTFIGWETSLCTGNQTCRFQLSANTVIGAYFSPPPNIMFVTSTTQFANLGGLAGADAICNQRAQAAGLAGTYKAWLSTPTSSAASRMGAASGWVRPDGKPVFNRLSDIPLNKFYYPPRLDEYMVDQGHCWVMTGTTAYGDAYTEAGGTTCGDFSSTAGQSVLGGYASGNSHVFTETILLNCSYDNRIYCMGVDRTALFLPPSPIVGRYAFTTKGFWKPGDGIASADALCQTEATQAKLPGTYKALLAANGKTAASRFDTAGPPGFAPMGFLSRLKPAISSRRPCWTFLPTDRRTEPSTTGRRGFGPVLQP